MNTIDLTQKKCVPCEGIGKALTSEEANEYLKRIEHWQLDPTRKVIFREYILKNFMAAVQLINGIAQLAEQENHHPDLHLVNYRKLRVDLTTHALSGLSENDFILAAKINRLPVELKNV